MSTGRSSDVARVDDEGDRLGPGQRLPGTTTSTATAPTVRPQEETG
ncbi:hypothetical protein [Oerskovia sp. KBS0722]|nr:hypothetical protein [Oerskovia sp. KBS0722]